MGTAQTPKVTRPVGGGNRSNEWVWISLEGTTRGPSTWVVRYPRFSFLLSE